jgi:hypothetical protein
LVGIGLCDVVLWCVVCEYADAVAAALSTEDPGEEGKVDCIGGPGAQRIALGEGEKERWQFE